MLPAKLQLLNIMVCRELGRGGSIEDALTIATFGNIKSSCTSDPDVQTKAAALLAGKGVRLLGWNICNDYPLSHDGI
jgi:hypothetical protein